MQDLLARAADVQLLVFDVDGVLTDGSLYLADDGQEYKAFHSRDGYGLKMLQDGGDVHIAVITGRISQCVAHRMTNLGIEHVYQGRLDKLPAMDELLQKLGFRYEQAAYVGDDIVDLPIMRRVGFAIAVQDAHPLVKKHAHWQTPSAGGRGAARDVCELLLEARGKLAAMFDCYM